MSARTHFLPCVEWDEVTGSTYREDCPECEGRGGWTQIVPVRGEYMAAEWYQTPCGECDETGEIGPLRCMGCDGELDGPECPRCEIVHTDWETVQ